VIGGSSGARRSTSRSRYNDDVDGGDEALSVGQKVEARYKGRSKYYPGVITRVRLDGTCDIDYDDGEKEMRVDKSLVKVMGGSSGARRSTSRSRYNDPAGDEKEDDYDSEDGGGDGEFRVGSKVEARHSGRRAWCAATISKVRYGGKSFDIEYDDFNEYEKAVPKKNLRGADVRRRNMYERLSGSGTGTGGDALLKDPQFTKGDRLACYWYRANAYSAPRRYDRPKAIRIVHLNSDGCYTVEFEGDGSFLDDVLEEHLEHWSTANEKLKLGESLPFSTQLSYSAPIKQAINEWEAVLEMAKAMHQNNKKHQVPSPLELERESNAIKKLKLALGGRIFDDFQNVFDDNDRHQDGDIDTDQVLRCFRDLDSDATVHEVRDWTKSRGRGGKPQKLFDFVDFMLLYANLFYPVPTAKDHDALEANMLAKSLRIDGEWKDLGFFARSFGQKRLRELERAFDFFAEKTPSERGGTGSNDSRMKAKSIMEAFHKVGKAITVSRMTDWMVEADVRPCDYLTLADFVSIFAYFFGPSSNGSGAGSASSPNDFSQSLRGPSSMGGGRLTLSEVAVAVLQEERWRGDRSQVDSFVNRLVAGRSEKVVDCIAKIRDGFEVLDEEARGSIPVEKVGDLLRAAGLSPAVVSSHLSNFNAHSLRLKREEASLPDLIEHFGLLIMDICDASVSVGEAMAMFRLHCETAVIRAAVDSVIRILDNIIAHSDNSKYWKVNILHEEFHAKVWRYESGKALLKAVGFDEVPITKMLDNGTKRSSIFLKALKTLPKQPTHLPDELLISIKSKRSELDQEVAVLEGAPSVSAAVREIRQHHSIVETRVGVETAMSLLQNVLSSPADLRMYRVKKANPTFFRSLGRLQGSASLMRSIGFVSGADTDVGDESSLHNSATNAIYVLKSVGKGENMFDASKQLTKTGSDGGNTKSFKFPALDIETEKFLWRRKADMELSLRYLDAAAGDEPPPSHTLSDAAHVSGTTQEALQASAKTRTKTNRDATARSHPSKKEVAERRARQLGNTGHGHGHGHGGKSSAKKASSASAGSSSLTAPLSLKSFMTGASAAQLVQINMIKKVFTAMDADGDELISASDAKAYFRSINRPSSDLIVRKWIRDRDVDQDGAVSLTEFVSSYAHVLDPASERPLRKGETQPTVTELVSQITEAFGVVRLGCSSLELINCVDAVENYIQRILDSPSTKEFWRLSINDTAFHQAIGRLFGGIKLMQIFQFDLEENGNVLALRTSTTGTTVEAVGIDVRKLLQFQLDELKQHKASLAEPSISNIAAVSTALGNLGNSLTASTEWKEAISTVIKILKNVIHHPKDEKFYSLNPSNPKIHAKIGRLQGGLEMLVSLGFREVDNSSQLTLPLETDLDELQARLLEFEVGLELISARLADTSAFTRAEEEEEKKIKDSNNSKLEMKKKSAASTKLGGDADASSAAAKKLMSELKEEKLKREKAETTLHHQHGLVQELQGVISTLQTKESKQLTLRQGLTIARLDESSRQKIQKEAEELGKDSYAFKSPSSAKPLSSSSKFPHSKTQAPQRSHSSAGRLGVSGASAGAVKDLPSTKSAPKTNPHTKLSHAASAGDVKLDIRSGDQVEFKQGMRILVGSGTRAEVHIVVGFGSLLIEKPLANSHPMGAPIVGFANDKNNRQVEKRCITEFCRGLILEDIVPQAAGEGYMTLNQRWLNNIYISRPVHQHSAILETQGSAVISSGERASVGHVTSSATGKIICTNTRQGVTGVDCSVSPVGLLNLFSELRHPSNEGLFPAEVALDQVMFQVELAASTSNIFRVMMHEHGAPGLTEMFHQFSGGSEDMDWAAFRNMMRPSLGERPQKQATSVLELQAEIKDAMDAHTFDEMILKLLGRLFDLMDCDHDELLTLAEAAQAFGDLDGVSPSFADLSQCYPQPIENGIAHQPSIDFHAFLLLRIRYARIMNTLPGGFRLVGRHVVKTAVQQCLKGTSSLVRSQDLADALPAYLAPMVFLQTRAQVEEILDQMPATVTEGEAIARLCGDAVLLARSVALAPCIQTFLHGDEASCCFQVAQLCLDSSGRRAMALSTEGVVHCSDVETGRKIFTQRVVWGEPLLSRTVEGSEKFVKWQRELSAHPDRCREHTTSASLLSQLLFAQPGLGNVMSVNHDGGLVAVNCSITSGSINCSMAPQQEAPFLVAFFRELYDCVVSWS
jgi:Ca2+-binding EF-hand superfamily protein